VDRGKRQQALKIRAALVGLVSLLLILCLPRFAAEGRESGGRVTLVVINRLCLEDLMAVEASSFRALAIRGGIGLMNTRTGGGLTAENAYTTIGGGARLVGGAGAKVALPAHGVYRGEKAGDIYRRRTGLEPSAGSIVVLDIENIKTNNQASTNTQRVGVIGDALRQEKQAAAVIGNADTHEHQRWAALIAMDSRGQIPIGNVDPQLNRLDPEFPTGRRTDIEVLWREYQKVRPQASFIVVDLGDMDRIEEERRQLAPSRYRSSRQTALRAADGFLAELLGAADLDKEWILIISPLPTGEDIGRGRLLTPIIAAGPGLTPGLLASGTTRRPGVVANYDIAPSVLSWLDLPAPGGLPGALLTTSGELTQGFSASGTAADNLLEARFSHLEDLLTRSAATYRQRSPLLKTFVTLEIIIYLTAFVLVVVYPSLPRGWTAFMGFLLLVIASTPLALLILPTLRPMTVLMAFLYTLVMAVLFATLAVRLVPSTEHRFALICALTALGIAADAFLGGPLIRYSPLGYDVMLGARFYGIGNEYMGILVGASLLAVPAFKERWPKVGPIVLLWFLLVIFTLGSPALGANAGGTITALIAFSLAYGMGKRRSRWAAVGLLLTLLVALLVLNLFPTSGVGSHVTRALRVALQGDWAEIKTIAQRKMAMNWRLMRYSIWSKGLLVALGIMGVLVYRPTPGVKGIIEEHPSLRRIVFPTIVGSLAALIFNDSGVVAGGTTSIYAAGLVLSLILEQRGRNGVR
jgi:hypothetical protein